MSRPYGLPLRLLLLSGILLAGGAAGCTGGADGSPACTRDLERIAEGRTCAADDECPCGSACLYGQCAAECLSDADCSSGGCDRFGQCTTGSGTAAVLPLTVPAEREIRVSGQTIGITEPDAPRVLSVQSATGQTEQVRVAATGGFEVSCDGGASFATSCWGSVPGDADAQVQVRAPADLADGAGVLSLYPRRGLPIRVALGVGPTGLPAPDWGPLAAGARFRGTITVEAMGASTAGDALAAETLPRIPVTAWLYPGADRQVLVIREAFGLLLADGELVGTLDGTQLSLPAWRFLGDDETPIEQAEVVAQPVATQVRAQPELLAFTLLIRFSDGSPTAATLRATVELRRSGDAPAGAPPPVPPSYVSLFPGGWQDAPAPWERRAEALCAPAGCTPQDAAWFACDGDLDRSTPPATYTLGADVLALSGDSACDPAVAPGRALAPAYLVTLDDVHGGGSPMARQTLLSQCWNELGSLAALPTGGSADLAPANCIQPVRTFGALAAAGDGLRAGDAAQAKRVHRLLTQLVETGAYLAGELVWAQRFETALGGDCAGDCPAPDTPEAQLLRPFIPVDVLYRPRYAQLADAAVAAADATALGGQPSLAYAVLRFASLEAELLERTLERAHRQGETAPRQSVYARVHRRLLLLRASAARWLALAGPAGAPPDEQSAVEAQLRRLDERYGRAARRILDMRRGSNPLGIADGQVPLYLDRDVDTPEARAFALTNYLLDPAGQNWIGQAIDRAGEALESVRAAWAASLTLDSVALAQAADADRYREEAARDYGSQILALCPVEGVTDVALVEQLASGERTLDPATCFLNVEDPACAAFSLPSAVTPHSVVTDLCTASLLRATTASAGVRGAPEANAFLDAVRGDLRAPPGSITVAAADAGGGAWTLQVGGTSRTFTSDELAALDLGTGGMASGRALSEFEGFSPREGDTPSSVADLDGYGPFLAAQQQCSAVADVAAGGAPPVAPRSPEALDRAECYRGGLGEAALATRGASTDLAAAQARLEEHYERYRIAVGACTLQRQADDALAAETQAYEEDIADLQEHINNLRISAGVFNTVSTSLASGATAAAVSGPLGVFTGIAGLAGGALNIAADQLQRQVDEKTAEHDAYMALIEQERDLRLCMNEASREMVGLRAATLEVRRAVQALSEAQLRFANLQGALRTLIQSGIASQRETHGARPYAGSLWLDASLALYESRMRLARRVTYLAALAVAYERQDCDADGYLERILQAESPAALEAVRADMLASTANRQIGNGTVGDAFVVLSLRDDLLQLASRVAVQPGEITGTPSERFRRLLSDPRFAVYEAGVYRGQLIPFELVPPEEAPTGYAAAAGYFSQNYCAERLWSVNVGIDGAEGASGSSTLTRVEVLKANEFYSRWCRPEAACDGQRFQSVGVNPAENLFLDPYADGAFLDAPRGAPSPWSRVVLSNVRTDVSRADLERSDYSQGAQSGFAGRGLFGRYGIFFPADALRVTCPDDPGCGSAAGNALDLTRVRDVLIRLDYVAGVTP